LLISFLVITLLGLAGVVYAYQRVELPDPNAEFLTERTQVFYGDAVRQADGTVTGTVLGDFVEQNRTVLAYEAMPQTVKDAVLAAENRGFWTDPGISVSGILRSIKNIVAGEPLQSGSTITQQYIKILYLTSDQTASRKAKEILLAVKMGRGGEMAKRDVLAGYLNTVYFGRGAYGIEAAAQTFFGVDAKDLTLPQSASLAVILNSPGNLDPAVDEANWTAFLERYEYVLDGLLEMGQKAAQTPQPYVGITAEQHADALAHPPSLELQETHDRYAGPGGFLLKMVEAELISSGLFTEQDVNGGGLQIVTTFDKQAQDAAVTAVQAWTLAAAEDARVPQDPSKLHGALASVAVGTGEVIALYGGPDFLESQINWATTPRMAGSTFKPYALIAALRQGFTLSTMLRGSTFTPPGDSQTVNNDSGAQYGSVSLGFATTNSVNTAYVDLVLKLTDGPQDVIKAANDLGVPTNSTWKNNGRIALGEGEVAPIAAANAFATVSNNGQYVHQHVVREVWDHGQLVCLWGEIGTDGHCTPPAATPALTPEIAATTTYALRSVLQEGTGSRAAAGFDWPVAGKTGSAGDDDEAESMRAAWYIGFTKQISTAVMFVAGDNGYSDLNPYASSGMFYGGTYPGDVWHAYMNVAMAGKEPIAFTLPTGQNRGGGGVGDYPNDLDQSANSQPAESAANPSPNVSQSSATGAPEPAESTAEPAAPNQPTLAPINTPVAPSSAVIQPTG
jgi:membrane peptidoglycan carboxypeptidase